MILQRFVFCGKGSSFTFTLPGMYTLKLSNSFSKILDIERGAWSPCADGNPKSLFARHTLHVSGTGRHQINSCWHGYSSGSREGQGLERDTSWVLTFQGKGQASGTH